MSEPCQVADRMTPVVPGLLHWTVHDDRVDFRSDAYALVGEKETVLVDPLPLVEAQLGALRNLRAIVLTVQSHQRSSWRYRKRFGLRVYAPEGAQGLEEAPDVSYGEGGELPLGLRALHGPGPCNASFALLFERPERGILFCGDLLLRDAGGFRFVDDEYQDDPERTRASVRRLADLPFEALCAGHGAPAAQDGPRLVHQALQRDAGGRKKKA
ncbi:MAG: MBL fold metallo-hydrolase [Deltaproteobacteria bacterium]|nr:MAG: MBL fold metallo-hydrolase [Deltaproteobacteria bacterium]TMB33392.1 MAG: MBL fold metallo-hydrolase [Deltaproteobacteria bacterium]